MEFMKHLQPGLFIPVLRLPSPVLFSLSTVWMRSIPRFLFPGRSRSEPPRPYPAELGRLHRPGQSGPRRLGPREAQPESRLIRLAARDSSVDNLLPALSSWIEIYLTLQESEKQDNSAEEIASLDDKILALNHLIIGTRGEITAFGEEHQIISLERDENRALNNIKGLSSSLDNAVEERAQATAKLAVIEQARLVKQQEQAEQEKGAQQ